MNYMKKINNKKSEEKVLMIEATSIKGTTMDYTINNVLVLKN